MSTAAHNPKNMVGKMGRGEPAKLQLRPATPKVVPDHIYIDYSLRILSMLNTSFTI